MATSVGCNKQRDEVLFGYQLFDNSEFSCFYIFNNIFPVFPETFLRSCAVLQKQNSIFIIDYFQGSIIKRNRRHFMRSFHHIF